MDGIQYCARKMPEKVPPVGVFGLSDRINALSFIFEQYVGAYSVFRADRRWQDNVNLQPAKRNI